jgi:uncharacterized protein with ParB-like and HNH nuclease domain
MDASTNIRQMLADNKIFVPTYQRAYSWDTETDAGKTPKQVNVFLSDLEDYIKSSITSKYYFGHFLFEKKPDNRFGVIDGQQRLTTIVIFLSALFGRLKLLRQLTDEEDFAFKSIIKIGNTYHFETVDYDNLLFKDYVINQTKSDKNGLDTESQKRIVAAFDFFTSEFEKMKEPKLLKFLDAVQTATCTTHPVENESEAIQMFIFQNNRGKKPSNLEIIKAQFMFNIHLYAGEEKDELIDETKNRFEKIYKSISSIECKIDEDDVLIYTQRVFFNSLYENNAIEKVNTELSKDTRIEFIKKFTQSLATSFEYITAFFEKEKTNIDIHSITKSGYFGILMPFVLKAYRNNVSDTDFLRLCKSMESLFVRHWLIGTRADMTSRINDVYKNFKSNSVDDIVIRIEWMKKVPNENWWWAYWNETALENALRGGINHKTAKFLLWKYENYLIQNEGKTGYAPIRFNSIKKPHLEHIAPQTENPESGYCEYDEEFRNQYIDCLGNYLLLSQFHNISIGNIPFEEKRNSYTQLRQQIEIQQMTETDGIWDKEKISKRKKKIIRFIMENF